MASLKTITTDKNKPVYIDESQNIVVESDEVLGGKSLNRPINGKELQSALDMFALMHPKVDSSGNLYYYTGQGEDPWAKVKKNND